LITGDFLYGNQPDADCLFGKVRADPFAMHGRILRQLRESKGRSQADVARTVGISPAQLARLEANQRGLYVEDFVNISEALGAKPGDLLPNDLGDIAHLKPLIDRLAAVKPELLGHVTAIIENVILLTEERRVPASVASKGRALDSRSRRPASRKERQ
jgi:transcriptional regulator with XRE-family HTH domain